METALTGEGTAAAAAQLSAAGSGVPPDADAPTQMPPAGEHVAERTEFAYYTHSNLQEMVKLADQKAATLIGGGGIIAAVLGSNLIDKFTPAARVLLVAGMLPLGLLVGAVVCAVMVLWPRFPPEKDVASVLGALRLLWATDISKYHRRPAEYVSALQALTPSDAIRDLAYENLKISWLLSKKWKWQRWATRLLLVAFISWFVTIGLALKG